MEKQPFQLIQDSTLQFIFLFSNADGFYVCSRYALSSGWIAAGITNAHQCIELYIKAILKLEHQNQFGHDLINLLKANKRKESFFEDVLLDESKVRFLKELSSAYKKHRYGEAGANSNISEIVKILDEMAFNLRNIYFKNIKYPNNKIFIPKKYKEDFLKDNNFFKEELLSHNPLSQMGFPVDMDLPENFIR